MATFFIFINKIITPYTACNEEFNAICDQIWEKPASTHTTARHTSHQTIAVHID